MVTMTDRYHGYPPNRAATFQPGRSSMPSSIGYTSLYAGDMHVLPSPSRQHHITTPTSQTTSTTNGIPTTTTRTYAVNQEPRPRGANNRDVSRNRRSTMDSSSRPPVIVTTTKKASAYDAGSHSTSNTSRTMSPPARHNHRASEQFFTQPASSALFSPRSTAPVHRTSPVDDEYVRPRERTDSNIAARDAEAYRSARPSVMYPSDPRHSTAAVDYGDDGYQYTNPSELVRYDLDHSKPARSRRRESMDRTYHRPNVQYDSGQRSLNVHSSADNSRTYNSNTGRLYDNRGGPPPSTRGFDKLKALPAAPPPPASTPAGHAELSGTSEWRDGKRNRPVSLYQDSSAPRSSHHDDFYNSREDERTMRELRDREPERIHNQPHYRDEDVITRGFGIRTGPSDGFDDRRDRRRESSRPRIEAREEPRKRSDEDLDRLRDERRRGKLDDKDARRPRRDSRRAGSDEEGDRSRLRDKLASGVGIAAAAVGLAPSKDKEKDKDVEKRERYDQEPRRRRSPSEDRVRRDELDSYVRPKAVDKDGERDRDRDRYTDREKDREYDRDYDREPSRRDKDDTERKERHRRDTESKLDSIARESASDSDEGKKAARRSRSSAAFDPNDTSDLKSLKDQLALMDVNENGDAPAKKSSDNDKRARSVSPAAEIIAADSQDESRGRELSTVSSDSGHAKTVRVVSPPREKKEEKPLRGILKQPSVRFPEDANPIREGVAPHRDDKKAKDVPQGAKWTKISRKVVNPEALTVGKERFEVRDDFVIVLRVLDKEEIQAYAAATKVLRERRRARYNEDDQGDDQDDRRRERRYQHDDSATEDENYSYDHKRDRDGDRRRRHRRDEEDRDQYYSHHHSHRDRDRAIEA